VAITFGELRHAAPDLFSAENDRDKVMVSAAPLGDPCPVEPGPHHAPARATHRQVPDEISSPFDPQGQGLVFSIGPSKSESAPAPLSSPRNTQPAHAPAPAAPLRGSMTSSPTPPPAAPLRISMTSSPTPPPPIAMPESEPSIFSAKRPLREMSSPRPAPAPLPPATPAKPRRRHRTAQHGGGRRRRLEPTRQLGG